VAKWRRVGVPFEFTTASHPEGVDVGWTWRIEGEAARYRQMRVIVTARSPGGSDPGGESQQAVRRRGESALDAYLDEESPPALILVSSSGQRRAEP